ncbi:hypothetical protein CHARACLAT_029409 [Characodon lateralis]|uniref:Uncharacterized protein n=1 Tax=Characodon lateralis TaxID=208331 RepID=A0ABU7EYW9_9TELE|nr:hypothetical protein [Characodon lateralis]
MSLVRRFIERELLQDITPFHLTKLDSDEEKNWINANHTEIGLCAKSVLKVMLLCSSLRAFSLHGKTEEFLSFKPMEQQLDAFLHDTLNQSYPEHHQHCLQWGGCALDLNSGHCGLVGGVLRRPP